MEAYLDIDDILSVEYLDVNDQEYVYDICIEDNHKDRKSTRLNSSHT